MLPSEARINKINKIWKGVLDSDFEHLNFLHLERLRTRENRVISQSGVVRVSVAKVISVTVSVCVAVIVNSNVITKLCTVNGTTKDCAAFLFGLQRKSPRRDVVRILQREKETLPLSVSKITVSVFACPSQRL
jgi:hypothetical protein